MQDERDPNDPKSQEPLPGDPDGASIDDAPMSEPDNGELTDEDVDMFEDDPDIPRVLRTSEPVNGPASAGLVFSRSS